MKADAFAAYTLLKRAITAFADVNRLRLAQLSTLDKFATSNCPSLIQLNPLTAEVVSGLQALDKASHDMHKTQRTVHVAKAPRYAVRDAVDVLRNGMTTRLPSCVLEDFLPLTEVEDVGESRFDARRRAMLRALEDVDYVEAFSRFESVDVDDDGNLVLEVGGNALVRLALSSSKGFTCVGFEPFGKENALSEQQFTRFTEKTDASLSRAESVVAAAEVAYVSARRFSSRLAFETLCAHSRDVFSTREGPRVVVVDDVKLKRDAKAANLRIVVEWKGRKVRARLSLVEDRLKLFVGDKTAVEDDPSFSALDTLSLDGLVTRALAVAQNETLRRLVFERSLFLGGLPQRVDLKIFHHNGRPHVPFCLFERVFLTLGVDDRNGTFRVGVFETSKVDSPLEGFFRRFEGKCISDVQNRFNLGLMDVKDLVCVARLAVVRAAVESAAGIDSSSPCDVSDEGFTSCGVTIEPVVDAPEKQLGAGPSIDAFVTVGGTLAVVEGKKTKNGPTGLVADLVEALRLV